LQTMSTFEKTMPLRHACDADDIAETVLMLIDGGRWMTGETLLVDAGAHLVEDLGMDSMMALEILAALEKKYKIKLPEEELPKITSVNRAIELVKQYVK